LSCRPHSAAENNADHFCRVPAAFVRRRAAVGWSTRWLIYWKSALTDHLADEVIEASVEYARKVPSPFTTILFAELHGACSRVGKTETAYFHRDLQYDAIVLSGWIDPADTQHNVSFSRYGSRI
jgi:hypothetical protein